MYMWFAKSVDMEMWICSNKLWVSDEEKDSFDEQGLLMVLFKAYAYDYSKRMPGECCFPWTQSAVTTELYVASAHVANLELGKCIDELELIIDDLHANGKKLVANDGGEKQKHGGWQPRIAQVVAAYWKKDWVYCAKTHPALL